MKSQRSRMTLIALGVSAGLTLMVGCVEPDSDDYGTAIQTLTGSISEQAYEGAGEILVRSARGEEFLFPTQATGRFSLDLPAGESYQFYLRERGEQGLEGASLLVFPRTDGRVDHTIAILGDRSAFDLGEIRPAGSYDAAQYRVEDASAQGSACAEEPGVHCVVDGQHPGCHGLNIAAQHRRAAHDRAQQARQRAEAARTNASSPEQAEQRMAPDAALRPAQAIALPQVNLPTEILGCNPQ